MLGQPVPSNGGCSALRGTQQPHLNPVLHVAGDRIKGVAPDGGNHFQRVMLLAMPLITYFHIAS